MRAATLTVVASALAAGSAFQRPVSVSRSARPSTTLYEHIPPGFTEESWAAFEGRVWTEEDELEVQGLLESLERGEAPHLMSVMSKDVPVSSQSGYIRDAQHVPRTRDRSDIRGAGDVRWPSSDDEWAGGDEGERSVPTFGIPLDIP